MSVEPMGRISVDELHLAKVWGANRLRLWLMDEMPESLPVYDQSAIDTLQAEIDRLKAQLEHSKRNEAIRSLDY